MFLIAPARLRDFFDFRLERQTKSLQVTTWWAVTCLVPVLLFELFFFYDDLTKSTKAELYSSAVRQYICEPAYS